MMNGYFMYEINSIAYFHMDSKHIYYARLKCTNVANVKVLCKV